MEESSGYQLILERGEVKGLIRAIREQGRLKFGQPNAEQLSALQRIQDMDRLEEVNRRILSATTWDELLA